MIEIHEIKINEIIFCIHYDELDWFDGALYSLISYFQEKNMKKVSIDTRIWLENKKEKQEENGEKTINYRFGKNHFEDF